MKVTYSMHVAQFGRTTRPTQHPPHSLPLTRTLLNALRRQQFQTPTCGRRPNPEYALKDATCSGATIADVRAEQFSALSANTNLVALTVGGNDAQFSTVVRTCLTDDENACALATGWMSAYARGQLVGELTGLYKDVKACSPKALLLVFGYPLALSTTGACSPIELSAEKRAGMNGLTGR